MAMTSLTRWATEAAASLPSIVVVRAMVVASAGWMSRPARPDGGDRHTRRGRLDGSHSARRAPARTRLVSTAFDGFLATGDGFSAVSGIGLSHRGSCGVTTYCRYSA